MLKILPLIGLFSLIYSVVNPKSSLQNLGLNSLDENPCHRFKKLKTAEDYFRSANNRTKGCCCPNDSVTTAVAAKEYGLAVKLNPKYWQARRNYARQLSILKKYDLAIQQLDEAIKLTKVETDFYLYTMRGENFYLKGMFEKAIIDYDIAIRYSGNIDYLLLLKAKALWKLDKIENACINYKKAIEMTPHLVNEKEFIICK